MFQLFIADSKLNGIAFMMQNCGNENLLILVQDRMKIKNYFEILSNFRRVFNQFSNLTMNTHIKYRRFFMDEQSFS